jgi:hypothetical protein
MFATTLACFAKGEMNMNLPSRTLAALLVAGSVPLFAGSAAAAPVAQSMGLKNADMSSVEQVQHRRHWRGGNWRGGHWRGGRWIGPAAAGFAAGAIVGGALAGSRYYDDGYYAYGAAPGYYAYGAAPGYGYRYGMGVPQTNDTPAPGSAPVCYGTTSGTQSAYPSWMCR